MDAASAIHSTDELAARLRAGEPLTIAHGLDGTFLACAAARAATALHDGTRPLIVVVPDEPRALALARDIQFFLGPGDAADHDNPAAPPRVLHLPAVESSPYAEISPDRRAILRRLATLFRLSQGFAGDVLVASAPALLRRVIPRARLSELSDLVLPEQELDRDRFISLLERAGYGRTAVVEDPGTFGVRGGVIDLFPPLYRYPVRIDFLGDLVESLRFFDPRTQRTLRDLRELYVHPVRETIRTAGADPRTVILEAADAAAFPSTKSRAVLEQIEAGEDFFGIEALAPAFHARLAGLDEYLPTAARWLVVDPDAIHAAARTELDDAALRFRARRDDHRLALPPESHYLSLDEFTAMPTRAAARVEARPLEMLGEPGIRFAALPNRELRLAMDRARAERADELLRPLVDELRAAADDGLRVAIVCSTIAHAERLNSLLGAHGIATTLRREPGGADLLALAPSGRPTLLIGPLAEGFHLVADGLLVIAEQEIFGPRSHTASAAPRTVAPKNKAAAFGAAYSDFSQLQPGDAVVHAINGVGLYRGLTRLPVHGTPMDFLHLEYDGGALYLPVFRLSEVTRYVGAEGTTPKLDRLGGVTWERTRRKVSTEVKKLAEDLLVLYAQRRALPGHAFPPADDMFREFEATFPFDETPDQDAAITAVLADMEQPHPMDRLVCGDVGYGKTEVAMRAALRAVQGGKQVAVLAPTTVLVEQHAANFAARLGPWPVTVAALSRFTAKADQSRIVREVAEGKIDIVIGTHRLLSNDVRWKDLGLIVVDEEQRFGVSHKERLKALRTQVDVLTLTATPIPRSLHMAMMGMRELSIIATPPVDRLAIRTFVCRPDDDVLAEGIRRELARGGQVFFVCHRIGEAKRESRDRSLGEWAEHLRQLVPGARVATAHGQMAPESLERVMVDFVAYRYDVLVCTTIVESGLDIPRANTMFVNRADAFGLAQLYQLRGRIGRSHERAFCYLMAPPVETLSGEAKQRLEVLQRFTELGAGFHIASHDLELRGAGDLLGASQSGHIGAVGFETYTRILEEAVAELRGEAIRRERDPELLVDLPGFIPDDYVPDTGQRLDHYKRLSEAQDEDAVRALLEELVDRYGDLPDEVKILGELMVVKAYGRRLGAVSIEIGQARIALALDAQTPLSPSKVLVLVNQKGSPYRLTPDMRLTRALTPTEQKDRLTAAKRCLLELGDCAN